MFNFNLTDELKFKIRKLIKKDKKRLQILNKKMKQIISCNPDSIKHYKNLKNKLKEFRRVHVGGSFVLTFKVDLKNNFILFTDLDHHDRIYN